MRGIFDVHVLRALVWLLPNCSGKRSLLRLLGHHVEGNSRVRPNVVWKCPLFAVGESADIGLGNVFLRLNEVRVETGAMMGQWNWVSSAEGFSEGEPHGRFVMHNGSAITSRHYIDSTGGVSIGAMALLSGHRSTVLTHEIDTLAGFQVARPVAIGAYSLVGSNTKLVAGSVIADNCVVGMGSVVVAGGTSSYALWAGCPARKIKDLPPTGWFTRVSAYVTVDARERASQ